MFPIPRNEWNGCMQYSIKKGDKMFARNVQILNFSIKFSLQDLRSCSLVHFVFLLFLAIL